MLIEFLEKAVATGCDSIEIEYKDGKEWVTAFWDRVGYGIGHLDPDEAKPMFKEMDDLNREKEVTIGGVRYRLAFSRYESFGEWVYRIQIKRTNRAPAASQRRRRSAADSGPRAQSAHRQPLQRASRSGPARQSINTLRASFT